MAALRPYTALARKIAASDKGSINDRWEFGRLVLVDDTKTTAPGNLRNGVLEALTAAVREAGREVAGPEIQRWIRCARAYPCRSQLRHAMTQYGTWFDLVQAGFPPFDADEGDRPYDPRTTAELASAHGRDMLPEPFEQLSLFARFDDSATLAEMRRYAEAQQELTDRFARRCEERLAYIRSLIKAVDGDESRTWAEARAVLAGQDGGDDGA